MDTGYIHGTNGERKEGRGNTGVGIKQYKLLCIK